MLFPQQNPHRAIYELNGYWRFHPDAADAGERDGWQSRPLPADALLVAVPGAWNEQLAECGLMNYVGCAWYERDFETPAFDRKANRLVLRVGAADHRASVWLNGKSVGQHTGGYLPFEIDLTGALAPNGTANRLQIAVDSRLTMQSLPQGIDPEAPPYNDPGYDRRHVFPPTRFDFFPYGGLTRSVQLLLVPADHVASIVVESTLEGAVELSLGIDGRDAGGVAEIYDMDSVRVAGPVSFRCVNGFAHCRLKIPSPRQWAPATPYMYSARVSLVVHNGAEYDRYDEPFGIRSIVVDGGKLLLNGEALYLVGFGKHEDFPIVGHGQFRPANLRDFELMRWIGANSFRTSHYPYDEELMQLADRLGFLVIDEVPAVSLGFLSDRFEDLSPLLDTHRRFLTELIERDRNHPSVIAWSTANEPNLWGEPCYQNDASRKYFRTLYDTAHTLDPERPVISITIPAFSDDDVALESCDLIGINRYFGWYTDPADLARAGETLDREMTAIYRRYGKPIIITECGVDAVEGFHAATPQMFTEEYQSEFLRTYASVAEQKPYCAGFHVWNFSDFLTPQHHRRVILNRKGVFTRAREPKGAAFFLRSYWTSLKRVACNHRPVRRSDSFLIQDLKSSAK